MLGVEIAGAELAADQAVVAMAEQPGFESATFLLDEDQNEYHSLSIWESHDAAEGAFAHHPQLPDSFREVMDGEMETHLYEVNNPTSSSG